MKKVLVFMAIVLAFVFSAVAQTIENSQLNPMGPLEQQPKITPPCPPCPTCPPFNGPAYDNSFYWDKKDTKKKTVVSGPSRPNISGSYNITNSGNTTTHNYNYYPQVQPSTESFTNYRQSHENDLLRKFLIAGCIIGLLLIAAYVLADWYRKKHPIAPGSTGSVSITMPPAPSNPAPIVVTPTSLEEIDIAITHAKETGGTFSREKDGGYTISFPKPKGEEKTDTPPAAEAAKEEAVKI